MSEVYPKIYLVRHGETAWTISGQHTGHTDIPLTENGERDAKELSSRLNGLNFTAVLTSPLQRARRTCELAGFGKEAKLDPDLKEWHYGAYESRSSKEIWAERPGWSLFDDGCPDGENLAEVSARAERVIARIRALKGDVLIFVHRDILRILAMRWLNLPAEQARRFHLTTTSLSILGYDHTVNEPVIRLWNDTQKGKP